MKKAGRKMKKQKTHKDFIEWLKIIFEKWKPILELGPATCDFKFKEECPYMECSNRHPYLDHRVSFNQKAFDDWVQGEENMEHCAVHEFCHILTDPLYNKGTNRYATLHEITDERERLTDAITQIVTKLAK